MNGRSRSCPRPAGNKTDREQWPSSAPPSGSGKILGGKAPFSSSAPSKKAKDLTGNGSLSGTSSSRHDHKKFGGKETLSSFQPASEKVKHHEENGYVPQSRNYNKKIGGKGASSAPSSGNGNKNLGGKGSSSFSTFGNRSKNQREKVSSSTLPACSPSRNPNSHPAGKQSSSSADSSTGNGNKNPAMKGSFRSPRSSSWNQTKNPEEKGKLPPSGNKSKHSGETGSSSGNESSGHNSLKDSKRRPPSQESDIEVQDWVVQTLGLGDSKLTGKDLDRISTLVSVYCNVSINIKKVLSKYKKEDIFKSVEEKNVKKKGKQATPERRKSDTHNSVPVAPPPDVHVEVQVIIQQSGKQTTSVKELKPEPEIETKPKSKSEQVPRASTPVSIHSKPAPSNDFEPTPGCSTDPDPLPRPRSRSDPRPKRRHVHFDPVPGEYDDLPPIRLVTPDLEPALPDLKDEPPRGISIFSNKSGKSIATDTKKVNVDADMMEIALIIYLAKKKKTTALKSLMDSM